MPAGRQKKNVPSGESPSAGKIQAIMALLDELYPEVKCSLEFQNPLELLVATILSAQCTDERVNRLTPSLFKKYPTARAFSEALLEELEADVKPTGFFRNKAKNIQACCRMLHERFQGEVPDEIDELVKLPGIGRKTANVILANAFGIPAVPVDTHVGRVAQRLGLTRHQDPDKIEQDLMALIPRDRWIRFCHQLIQHGRSLCLSRKPKISQCPLRPHCDYAAELGQS